MVKVHSFDVFDTSLIRQVAAPTDVFRLMGAHIAQIAQITDQSEFTQDFLSARIRAEKKARSYCEETNLNQIWENLREMMPHLPLTFGPADELDAERRLLRPNSLVAQLIAGLRSSGARIIFTSDTYLPEDFVREQLLHYGLAEDNDRIYASSTTGRTKWKGGLFEIILNCENIAARDLHHYGDDPNSDIAMPQRLGIGTTLLTDSRLNTWERALLSKDVHHRMATSLLAGSMRGFRLSTSFQSTSSSDALVATLLGPALMVWAAWVLGAAQRDGIRRLYFVSRDAYLLCRAARVLAPHFGDIDCRHLKISRQSVSLPSTEEISPSGMSWVYRPWEPAQLGYLVQKIGLSWSDVVRDFSSLAMGQGESKRLTTESEWNEFWSVIQKAPVADLLRQQIKNKRTSALAYLRAEGLCDKVRIGIVDIGWYAMTQMCLRKLLDRAGGASTIKGYYLALFLDRMAPADTGNITALFYDQATDHRAISHQYEVFNDKRIGVLEHIFGLAPHGSVREYTVNDSRVEPVYLLESTSHEELVGKVGDAIEAFCKNNQKDASFYSDNATAREIIDSLLRAWCVYPSKFALKVLDDILVTEGPDNRLSMPLLEPWGLIDAAKTLIPGRWHKSLKIKLPNPIWPEAAYYRSGLFAKLVLRLSRALRLLGGYSKIGSAPPFKRLSVLMESDGAME